MITADLARSKGLRYQQDSGMHCLYSADGTTVRGASSEAALVEWLESQPDNAEARAAVEALEAEELATRTDIGEWFVVVRETYEYVWMKPEEFAMLADVDNIDGDDWDERVYDVSIKHIVDGSEVAR